MQNSALEEFEITELEDRFEFGFCCGGGDDDNSGGSDNGGGGSCGECDAPV